MGPKSIEKNAPRRKERVNREEQNKFDPLRLEVKYPGTAILLLQCQEQPILLAAAAALAKFGRKAQGNLEVLFDLAIVDSVMPLIEHEDLFTRRFAAMLLAEMTAIPNVRNFLSESSYYIPHFTRVLINDKDIFMQEFSSLILAELSEDMFGAAQLLKQCPHVDFLFERLESPDPDVKRNNIQIIHNLLQDLTGAEAIVEAKSFDLNLIYNLFESPYPEIQGLALNVVADLVSRNRDDRLQDLFRQSNGLQALLKFLDNDEWQDLHAEAFRILRLAADNPATIELFDDIGGVAQILNYLKDTPNSKLFIEALDVAVCLSQTPRGRQALYAYGIVDHLLLTLEVNTLPNLFEIVCRGIGMMTLHNEAAIKLTEHNCIKDLLDILRNESLNWAIRQAALFALSQLLKCDVKNCHEFLGIQGQNYLVRLMRQTDGTVPVEVLVGAVQCLTTVARNQILRSVLINADIIDVICASFELPCLSMVDYKIACCEALSVLCVDKAGRAGFLRARGPRRLYNLLCDVKTIPIRSAAAQLVQLLCADPDLANAFVTARYLNYMLNNRSTARIVPSWDTCIEALFDSHLPMKFAFTGRLSLHDVTQDGFYVLRRNVCPFPVLDDILKFQLCPMEPIYVINCIRSLPSSSQEETSQQRTVEQLSRMSIGDMMREGIFLSAEILSMTMESKFGRLQCDTCLYDFLELFKYRLVAAESKEVVSKTRAGLANVSYVASRAKMLGKFVAQQLSGPDPLIRCVDHQLEIHLKEIKDYIETSVIPLGMLRVGSYLERALLFKVMADRIHLPAALVRGEYGKAWIEIAVPQVKDPSEEASFESYIEKDTSCPEVVEIRESVYVSPYKEDRTTSLPLDRQQSVFPTKLMRPNFIVDLMDKPGDLLPIGSHRARVYCEKELACERICLD